MCTFRFMLVFLSIGIVCTLAQGTAFAGVVAHWEFSDDLTDSSGNGHTGVPTNGAVSYITDGDVTALSLTRFGSYVTIPGSSDFQFSGSGAFTLEARVKFDGGTHNMVFESNSDGGVWFLRTSPADRIDAAVYDGVDGREMVGDTTDIADSSNWFHVAMVYDGNESYPLATYINYAAEGVSTWDTGSPIAGTIGGSGDNWIGKNGAGNLSTSGVIDYIRVSDVALDPTEFIGYTPLIPGDANSDRVVNAADAAILAANWQTQGTATWEMGDFNGDNNVDGIDATMLATNWQGSAAASVPEPGCIILLAGGLIALLMRRRCC